MEHEDKVSELNLTEEEMGRFTKAFKDENFRKMLRDYAEEISDPQNRKKYEEEIAILEQDRGNSVQFIHPTPFKCVRASVNGKLKCYVNVCANDKIARPSCKYGVSENGNSGHHWSLPHSLHPERKEMNAKGNKILLYDVVFHPDTLHMASTNERFMDMVTSVALESIQDAFNVRLDKNNIRTMKTKYKGNPQACVIRKPIPGFEAKDASDDPDPLAFPYPENKATVYKKEGSQNSQSQSEMFQKSQEPTKPHHTIKYRSFIDLQDFRCSRDSSQSPRPREIVITIDLPLLKSVSAATLEVKEKTLLLESQDPAYKLELNLAYAVDEDKGEAKFNNHTRQLVVMLPVRPSEKKFQISSCPADESANDIEEEAQDSTDLANAERQVNSQESNAAEKTGGFIEREDEEGAAQDVKQVSADRGQHQDIIAQRQSDGHQDGTKMEKHERVTYDQIGETTIQAGGVRELEQEAIQEGTESKTLPKLKTKNDQPKAQVCTEDPVGPSELVPAAEEMDHLKSEKSFDKANPLPVLLREVSEDGSHTLISDHVTTAGFSFHNSLLFELD